MHYKITYWLITHSKPKLGYCVLTANSSNEAIAKSKIDINVILKIEELY